MDNNQIDQVARGLYEAQQGATMFVSWYELPSAVRNYWRGKVRNEEVIVDVGMDDDTFMVVKVNDEKYNVLHNEEVRYPYCTAEDAMRALGNYLHSKIWQIKHRSGEE